MNLFKQIHDISIQIRHEPNRQKRTQLKQQLAELTAQLPPKTEGEEETTTC